MQTAGRDVLICILATLSLGAGTIKAQTTPASVRSLLAQPVQSTAVVAFQLQQYLSHPRHASALSPEREGLGNAATEVA